VTRELDIAAIAAEIKAAQDGARPIELVTSRCEEFDLESAYAVAGRIHEARLREGADSVGRKIGFTNPAMWAALGVGEPIWGHVYDTTVVRVAGGRHTCRIGRFAEPRIEPEIVLHFRATPPEGGGLPAILGCVDWVAHGLEIVQSHFPGWKFRAADAIADSALHGTLLVGEPRPVESLGSDPIAALEFFTIDLSRNGEIRATGKGSDVLGNPLAAIAHLVAVLVEQAAPPLRAGEIVTTGTVTVAQPIVPGETWRTALHGIVLPGLAVSFVA